MEIQGKLCAADIYLPSTYLTYYVSGVIVFDVADFKLYALSNPNPKKKQLPLNNLLKVNNLIFFHLQEVALFQRAM